MSTASEVLLPVAKETKGSSTANVAVFTVVVLPETVRSPEIVTLPGSVGLLGILNVTAPVEADAAI